MKPIKLTMQAFGPYVQKQEVDFTLFENKGLFLIMWGYRIRKNNDFRCDCVCLIWGIIWGYS